MSDTNAPIKAAAQHTAFSVLFAISFCHLLNDLIQAVLPAIYPDLKNNFHLSFAQVGLVTTAFQCTASLLQPLVGHWSDKKPAPYSLAAGMLVTMTGIVAVAFVSNYAMLLFAALLIGVGSSVFHPESSRVARMASGGRNGLAQAMFQVGGNTGSALGPLSAALVIASWGQKGVVLYSAIAMLGAVILFQVGTWYKHHGLVRMHHSQHAPLGGVSNTRVAWSVVILLLLIFSKFFYLTAITSYFTFYLIETFQVSVAVAQVHLFAFLAAVAVGTFLGGPLGDHFGRKYVIWFSILGCLPFALMLPFANLFWIGILSAIIGMVMASAFPAIVVYAQELLPGRVGMVSGLFYGFAFGMGGLGAALLGALADATSIAFVYKVCAFLPAIGLLTMFLPNLANKK